MQEEVPEPAKELKPFDPPSAPVAAEANGQWDQDITAAARLSVVMVVCLFTVFIAGAILSNSQARRSRQVDELLIGYGYASTFAVLMSNVIWSALGAGKYRHRLAFAAMWNLGVVISTFSAMGINGPPTEIGQVLVVFVLFLTAAWLLPQAPLWIMRIFWRTSFDIPGRALDGKANQFGILHLMGVTGLVALFLGGARAAISIAKVEAPPDSEPFLGFGFLVLCAAVTSVPLWVAMLIDRYVFAAIVVVLALVIVASYWQQTLLGLLINMRGGPPPSFFIWQTVFISGWTLIFAYVMRVSGYRFIRRAR